ncbi:hypothetical protein BGX26_004312, partial [Mortierella sp. AD094]
MSHSRLSGQAFVVNADLWLEDETSERNLVLISSISSTKLPNKLPLLKSESEETSSPLESRSTGPLESRSSGPAQETEHDSIMHRFAGQNQSMTSYSSIISSKSSPIRPFPADDKTEHLIRSESETTNHPSNDTSEVSSERREEKQTSQLHVSGDLQSETSPDAHYDPLVSLEEEDSKRVTGVETDAEDPVDWDSLTTQNLVGQTSVGGQIAPDLDEKTLCVWFAFSTLSIRTEGVFKLRFSLFDLTQMRG